MSNQWEVRHGDALELLRSMPDNSVDAVVTDPPYGLSFMGKKWDYDVPATELWAECLRVLKPGGHLLAFAGTRTQHRMAVRIEDAGFEIRDMIAWVYGSGFPKSLDVSKAIAKRAGGDVAARDAISFMRDRREELGLSRPEFEHLIFGRSDGNVRNWEDGISLPKPGLWADIKRAMGLEVTPFDAAMERGDEVIGSEGGDFGYQKNGARWDEARVIRAPVTEAARQWQGWGTALKPSTEPLTFARKPLDLRGHCLYLVQYITTQICLYAASAKSAEPSSSSSLSASGAEWSASALWTAVERCNTPGDLFALMDTLPSGLAIPTTLSTALSWLSTLGGLLQHESTFTTEPASSLTTDLKTLNCLLSSSTQSTTIADWIEPSGRWSSAELVASLFNAFDASLKSTLARSAHESAIARAQESYLDAGASPALEPITVARKPLDGTVAENVQQWGTGAINVDGCRVEGAPPSRPQPDLSAARKAITGFDSAQRNGEMSQASGRWPANVIHDGSEEVVAGFPDTKGGTAVRRNSGGNTFGGSVPKPPMDDLGYGDSGSAARFFYCAKASRSERNAGLEGVPCKARPLSISQWEGQTNGSGNVMGASKPQQNHHPTVKPIALMRYLCRLVTPPGGTVLDPFTGSGTTGIAAKLEGFNFIGCEREAEYVAIATARIAAWEPEREEPQQPTLFDQ